MKNTKRGLVVVYGVLPLLIISFSMGALMLFIDPISNNTNTDLPVSGAFSTLGGRPVSLICRDTSGNLFNEMKAIEDDFIDYNRDYGVRLDIQIATGSSATLSRVKTYISTTERMHLTAHGTWTSSSGPKLLMYGGYLTEQVVNQWSLSGGLCKFIFLSACNSIGHDGMLDIRLTYALRTHTSVVAVTAFNDVVNIVAATLLSQSFWGYHVTLTSSGGLSAADSFTNSRDRILAKVAFIRAVAGIGLSAAVGFLVGLAISGLGAAVVGALLGGLGGLVAFWLLLDYIVDTVNSWQITGGYVVGLHWGSAGGGKNRVHLPD